MFLGVLVGQLADLLVFYCTTPVPGIMTRESTCLGCAEDTARQFLGCKADLQYVDGDANDQMYSPTWLPTITFQLHRVPEVLALLAEMEATLAQPNVISYRCLADLPRLGTNQSW